jgi:hypothetical protein
MKDLFDRHSERLTEAERADLWERVERARRGGAAGRAWAWRPAAAAVLAAVLIGGVFLVVRARKSGDVTRFDVAANREIRLETESAITDGGAPAEMTEPQALSRKQKTEPEPAANAAEESDAGKRAGPSVERLRSLEYVAKSPRDEGPATADQARDVATLGKDVASAPSATKEEFAQQEAAPDGERAPSARASAPDVGTSSEGAPAGAAGAPPETTTLASAAPASGATDVKYEFRHRAINTVEDALSKEAGVVEADGQLFVRGGRADETKYFAEGLSTDEPLSSSRASYDEARRAIDGGRLPAADSIRVREFVNAFPDPDRATAAGDFAILFEGAPRPFPGPGEPGHVIRVVVRWPGPSGRKQPSERLPIVDGVEFDPTVVKDRRRLAGGLGGGVALLYDVQLVEGVSAGTIATMKGIVPATAGDPAPQRVEARIDVSDVAASFDAASPRFRLAALAAEFAEVLERRDASAADDLAALAPYARRVAADLADDPAVAEFARLVERAAEIARAAPAER